MSILWQRVRRIANEILGVKRLKVPAQLFNYGDIPYNHFHVVNYSSFQKKQTHQFGNIA